MLASQKDTKNTAIDISDTAGAAVGAAAGSAIGTIFGGPIGAAGGAVAGSLIEKTIAWAGKEIKERCLSKSEAKKLGTVYDFISSEVEANLNQGKHLRTDHFFDDDVNDRSSSEEILEATLFAAQRECEEKKLPYLAKLYANIAFDETVNRNTANYLIKTASDLTYRQFAILSVIGLYQLNIIHSPLRRDTPYKELSGYENIAIATEIFDLYTQNLCTSKNALFDAAGINPSLLELSGNGATLFNLMELSKFSLQEPSVVDIIKVLTLK